MTLEQLYQAVDKAEKKLGNGFSFTHQLVGGISDYDLWNAGESFVD
jgi:hypothetical protein